MTIIKGKSNVYHLKKVRKNKRRTLIRKNEGRKMIKAIFTITVILSLATAAYAQIAPITYKSGTAAVDPIRIVVPRPVPETTEQTIRRLAKEANFKWTEYLVRLAKCENPGMDPKNYNDKKNNPPDSIDRGQFMINDHWHAEVTDKCAYNLECATKWTMNMINIGHQWEWVCDEKVRIK